MEVVVLNPVLFRPLPQGDSSELQWMQLRPLLQWRTFAIEEGDVVVEGKAVLEELSLFLSYPVVIGVEW